MSEEIILYLQSLKKDENLVCDSDIQAFLNYFEDYFNKYPIASLSKIKDITYEELVLSFILSHCSNNFSLALAMINKYSKYFFKGKWNSDIYILFGMLHYFNDVTTRTYVDCIVRGGYLKIIYESFSSVGIPEKTSLIYLACLFRENPEMQEELSFLQGIKSYNISIFFSIIWFIKYHKYEIEIHDFTKKSKDFKKDFDKLSELLSMIYTNYERVKRELSRRLSKIKKNNRNIDELILNLKVEGEITKIDYLLKLCPNEEAKERVTSFILEHNIQVYNKKLEECGLISDNTLDNLSVLFGNFGYDFVSLEESIKEKFLSIKYEDIEEILMWLKKYALVLDINDLLLINLDKIRIVEALLSKGILDIAFVKRNLYILFNNEFLDKIVSNIRLLRESGVNVINYHNSLEILLSDKVSENLKLLGRYGILITKETREVLFLKDDNLADKIEIIIEMGFLNLRCLDILNKSIEELFKIKILRHLDVSMTYLADINYSDYYFDYSKYFANEEIDNASEHTIAFPSFLERYLINDFLLLINGVFVSKIKLLDNLKRYKDITFLSVFYAIIKGGYYTFEEIEALQVELIPEVKDLYGLINSIRRERVHKD